MNKQRPIRDRPQGSHRVSSQLAPGGRRGQPAGTQPCLAPIVAALCLLCFSAAGARADLCTTQARMADGTRTAVAASAMDLARAVESGDPARVKSMTIAEYGSNFDATAFLVRSTAAKIAGSTPVVTQIFTLDATARKPDDSGTADFSCALSGSTSEVDFSIAGLPPGTYAFAMVDARGPHPWLLSFLLRQDGNSWKMAGFYPRAREAAGHDGLWYWTSARDRVKAGQKWLAWMYYGEADELLRPANFVTSTHLDALRNEQRTNAPGELSDGVSAQTPLVIKGASGRDFRYTDLHAQGSEDGKRLDLLLHVTAEPSPGGAAPDPAAQRAFNIAAAAALLSAHPELRTGFSSALVFSETAGGNPFVTQHPFTEIQ